VAALLVYSAIGFGFAVFFVASLLPRHDAAARGTSAGFRLLVFPGAMMLWPLVLAALWRRL
jgi:hypothetical protein